MDFIAIVIIALLVGFYIGWKVHEMFIIHVIETDPEIIEEACKIARKGQTPDADTIVIRTPSGESVTTTGVELLIEQVNDVMYAYAKDTNQFVAQGSDLKSLMEEAHKRYPGKTFFGDLPEEHQNS